MSDTLSKNEIEALLDESSKENVDINKYEQRHNDISIVPYDFRRPNRISKEQLRSIRSLHGKFCRELSSKISSVMRTIIDISLHSVDQMTYGEFLMSLPSPTSFNVFSMRPLDGSCILELNQSVIFPIIDKLLGGFGETYDKSREFTDIEFLMIDNILSSIMSELMKAWEPYIKVSSVIETKESSPNVLQVVAQNEFIIMCVMEMSVGSSSGMMNICYPIIYLEPILQKLSNRDIMMHDRESQKSRNKELRVLAGSSKALTEVFLGITHVPVEKLLSLSEGDIVLFPRAANEDVIISVNKNDLYYATLCSNEYRKMVIINSIIVTEKDKTKRILQMIEDERTIKLGTGNRQ